MTKPPITRPATAEKTDGSTPVKSSTQMLLEEITRLRQINEVLLRYENKKRLDRHWRYRILLYGFVLSVVVTVISLYAGNLNAEMRLGFCVVYFAVLLILLPAEWRE